MTTDRPDQEGEQRRDYADYRDPLAGFGGAPPAYSALTLRLVLAAFGLLVCTAGAVLFAVVAGPVFLVVVLVVLAAIAAVDIVVMVHRQRRGEPG
jgi:fatty acid desaturase